jgi:hypothetical protein
MWFVIRQGGRRAARSVINLDDKHALYKYFIREDSRLVVVREKAKPEFEYLCQSACVTQQREREKEWGAMPFKCGVLMYSSFQLSTSFVWLTQVAGMTYTSSKKINSCAAIVGFASC